jgi:hypothetical protein
MVTKRSSKDIAKAKLAKLKTKHFTPKGREQRIAKALETLSQPGPTFKLDRETWIWAAQDAEIEDEWKRS